MPELRLRDFDEIMKDENSKGKSHGEKENKIKPPEEWTEADKRFGQPHYGHSEEESQEEGYETYHFFDRAFTIKSPFRKIEPEREQS